VGAQLRNASILIIDDDEPMSRMIAVTLRSSGHRVTIAHDGRSGLKHVESQRPDVIVLDRHLPGMDGRTFCRELRERGIDTPVMIVAEHQGRLEQRELGAQASISKPFRADDLANKVEEILAVSDQA
jgi:DNA-binding response OmpR family regulator